MFLCIYIYVCVCVCVTSLSPKQKHRGNRRTRERNDLFCEGKKIEEGIHSRPCTRRGRSNQNEQQQSPSRGEGGHRYRSKSRHRQRNCAGVEQSRRQSKCAEEQSTFTPNTCLHVFVVVRSGLLAVGREGKERERERDAFKLIELGLAHLRQRIFEIYTRKQ